MPKQPEDGRQTPTLVGEHEAAACQATVAVVLLVGRTLLYLQEQRCTGTTSKPNLHRRSRNFSIRSTFLSLAPSNWTPHMREDTISSASSGPRSRNRNVLELLPRHLTEEFRQIKSLKRGGKHPPGVAVGFLDPLGAWATKVAAHSAPLHHPSEFEIPTCCQIHSSMAGECHVQRMPMISQWWNPVA